MYDRLMNEGGQVDEKLVKEEEVDEVDVFPLTDDYKEWTKKDQLKFLQKMYGLHATQVFFFAMWIVYCQMNKDDA